MFAGRTPCDRIVPTPARRLTRRAGLGLVEAMVALAITAALLTAVAAAFSASTAAINENDEFFTSMQTGRVALNRILTQVRRGAVDDNSTSINLHLLTDAGTDVTYKFDSANKQVTMTKKTAGVDTVYTLAKNVTAASFDCQSGTDYAGRTCVVRVAVQLTVKVNNNTTLLSGTGAPRRNLAF